MVWESSTTAMTSTVRPTTLFATEAGPLLDNDSRPPVRRQKKRRAAEARVKKFSELYESTGELLGEGSFGQVATYRNINSGKEFAVKVVAKTSGLHGRQKMLKEIETFHHCRGHENILQLIEYFEEDDRFYVVFEKMEGGTLLDTILARGHLTELEASAVVRDIARALSFLHNKGIAHRDLKPENILCVHAGRLTPVKVCDFDLGSGIQLDTERSNVVTTPELLSPVGSADFMAPEVVDVWLDHAWSYDKRCDLWSLGTILYILLCGYRPFYATCGQDCGFAEGKACDDCQELLFKCIQNGVYHFPEREWGEISAEARDLVEHLLVRDPRRRYTADQVLAHPWLSQQASLPRSQLATPFVLSRTNSVRELGLFAENANAVNRLIQQHMSITEARTTSYRYDDNDDETAAEETAAEDDDLNTTTHAVTTAMGGLDDCSFLEGAVFHLGLSSDDEGEEYRYRGRRSSEEDRGIGGMWSDDELTVSPYMATATAAAARDGVAARCKVIQMPGKSKLALRRRQAAMHHRLSTDSVDSGNLSSCSPPTTGFSPPQP
jgi:MAP kinase interacting serine/threonine kinase